MANPTSNFGWQMPTNTDLVKDLPADFEVFGQAVDTSLMDLKGGTTGQILSKASNTDMDFTWIANDLGDITAVTAGTGISGGGTSGAVTITNSMATAIDARGDLVAGTGADAFARLAVGNNGETLVADSSASTGLRWQGNFAAGKNKIINGDFSINQRGFTTANTDASFGFDRWALRLSGATGTYTAETFTLGSAPVAGYEARNYAKLVVTTGNDLCRLEQRIEDVRTFAGQTVTLSFWAKGVNPTTAGNLAADLTQWFGTGGSPSSEVILTQQTYVLTANWTRYSFTFSIPSISGKTLGTNNDSSLRLRIGQGTSTSTDSWTLEIWGVQLEAGNVATAFQTATGTLAGELQAAQRYYWRINANADSAYAIFANGGAASTTRARLTIQPPTTMRVKPTAVDGPAASNFQVLDPNDGGATATAISYDAAQSTPNNLCLLADVASGLTQFRPYILRGFNTTSAYLGFTSEL